MTHKIGISLFAHLRKAFNSRGVTSPVTAIQQGAHVLSHYIFGDCLSLGFL